jgi:hypothetical protein
VEPLVLSELQYFSCTSELSAPFHIMPIFERSIRTLSYLSLVRASVQDSHLETILSNCPGLQILSLRELSQISKLHISSETLIYADITHVTDISARVVASF